MEPGLLAALAKVFPATRQQRCWVHKTANVLDKLPKNQQPAATAMLHEIWMAAIREDATKAFDRFVATYGGSGRGRRTAWRRTVPSCWRSTTSPPSIGDTFAPATRSRAPSRRCVCATYRTNGPGSREAGLAMAFKLARKAESSWRKLNGSEKLQDLIDGIAFVDGIA